MGASPMGIPGYTPLEGLPLQKGCKHSKRCEGCERLHHQEQLEWVLSPWFYPGGEVALPRIPTFTHHPSPL